MLERIFFLTTAFFSLLFLILSVAIESWPCGGVFTDACQVAVYATRPVGALICITIIVYAISVCLEVTQLYWKSLAEETQQIISYAAIACSAVGSLFVMSAMLAFYHRYSQSWSVILGSVGMTLGFSGTFQLVLKLLREKYSLGGELP